ncbi:hypothetical protein BDA99DRAFT_523631, partial [Phascolomyces articulosus]
MPNTKKKQPPSKHKSSSNTNNNQNGHHSISSNNNDSTTTSPLVSGSKKIKAELAQEQCRLYRELDDYINQFRQKASEKHVASLSHRELIILFVMNLHARWKRIVEPEEYRFKDWEEAAQVARYHAIKVSILLGAERCDQDPMFTSKEAKDVLASGYFKYDSNNNQHSLTTNMVSKDTVEEKKQEKEKKIPVVSNQQDENTSITEKSDTTTTATTEKQSSTTTASSNATPTTPSTSSNKQQEQSKKEKKKEQKKDEDENDRLTHTQRRGKLIIPSGANKKSVCYKIPSAHKDVNLPFVDLIINGYRVRHCLLAKKRWGASAMSVALQEDLKLTLNRSDACDIGTEFGQVNDAIGSVNCMIQHPCNASLVSELAIQVMPALYGGKVDLILGADFFFFFGATFNLKYSMLRFMGQDAPFYPDKFTS